MCNEDNDKTRQVMYVWCNIEVYSRIIVAVEKQITLHICVCARVCVLAC
jgi:hypothetical protein